MKSNQKSSPINASIPHPRQINSVDLRFRPTPQAYQATLLLVSLTAGLLIGPPLALFRFAELSETLLFFLQIGKTYVTLDWP